MAIRTLFFVFFAALLGGAQAKVTVYGMEGQKHIATGTGTEISEPTATTKPLAAYNTRILTPPPIPDPRPPNQFGIQLAADAVDVNGLSIPQSGAFYGFSVEMSVVTQCIGLNGSYIHPTFLNLMSLIVDRAGRVHVRIGGNTQERARMVPSLGDGKAIEKEQVDSNNPTATPAVLYTPEILYLLSNISALTNIRWYLGVPLNDSANLALDIALVGQQILGDNLLGLQVGNEPDLYARHANRPETYTPFDYFGEFGSVLEGLRQAGMQHVENMLIGPSIATGDWTPEMVWDTGFIPSYHDAIHALTVEHYPDDNCGEIYEALGPPKEPQDQFANFLTHSMGVNTIAPYLNSTRIAQESGKPFIMFETNTASCGGYSGISTSFGAALWAIDYGLEMAASNFSHALLHVGGQNVYYNPFTAVPTNESHFHEWTVGPIFYSVMAVSETLGSTNNSRIIDLWQNAGNMYTPGYAIYENEKLARLAFVNFMTDPTGANDYTVTISVGGGQSGKPNATPAQVKVKYLVAPSVSDKFNLTWGGQSLGGQYEADGRLKGDLKIETIPCDQAANTCQVKVPAPGFALVYMTDDAADEATEHDAATFPTTAITKFKNTATIDEAVLATSNGDRGQSLGSTSFGSANGNAATSRAVLPSVAALVAMVAGAGVLSRAFSRQV